MALVYHAVRFHAKDFPSFQVHHVPSGCANVHAGKLLAHLYAGSRILPVALAITIALNQAQQLALFQQRRKGRNVCLCLHFIHVKKGFRPVTLPLDYGKLIYWIRA